jgi:hypothetical protein
VPSDDGPPTKAPLVEPEPLVTPPARIVDLSVRAIGELDADITLPGEIAPPEDLSAKAFADRGEVFYAPGPAADGLALAELPGGFCHRPLYFEEYYLERHGRSFGALQPAVSAAHFFATVPAMPYLMTVNPSGRCSYIAGVGPDGGTIFSSGRPIRRHLAGAIVQGGVITGLGFILP